MQTTSLKTASVPSQGWEPRDVIVNQFSHGVRLTPRLACDGDNRSRECARSNLFNMMAEVVLDYLSHPIAQDEAAMPLVTLRTWLCWRMKREEYGSVGDAPRHASAIDALEIVTWVLNQRDCGLSVVPIKRRRQAAA